MNVIAIPLPPTKSHAERWLTWVRIPANPLLGVIEIRESRKPGSTPKCGRYAIRIDPMGINGERRYRLTKPGGSDWYDVCLSDAEFDTCDCHGCVTYRKCKHLECLRKLDDRGLLELPEMEPSL